MATGIEQAARDLFPAGDELNTPLLELLAAERGWSVLQETGNLTIAQDAARAEAMRHTHPATTNQATISGDLLNQFFSALLVEPVETGRNCSKPLMVRLLGRYCNSETEAGRLRDLCHRAAAQHVKRQHSPPGVTAPRLSKAQNERIAELYRTGLGPVDIAREIGTSEWTIHHRLNRLGVERRPHGMNPVQCREAVQLYDQGLSMAKIAKRLGFNDKTIKKALIEAGVTFREVAR